MSVRMQMYLVMVAVLLACAGVRILVPMDISVIPNGAYGFGTLAMLLALSVGFQYRFWVSGSLRRMCLGALIPAMCFMIAFPHVGWPDKSLYPVEFWITVGPGFFLIFEGMALFLLYALRRAGA